MSLIAFPLQPSRIRPPPPPADESGDNRIRLSVIALAQRIESDSAAIDHWYDAVPIVELGGGTARELVDEGQGTRVLGFLAEIMHGRRG